MPRPSAALRRSWRLPGCCRGGPSSCRSPAPATFIGWRRTPPRPASACPPTPRTLSNIFSGPAPPAIASAIAARTSRMKIGIAVQVLPLCHPLRLAEEAATVDQISHGRLIFGVGRSGVVSTYDAYQVPYDESRERFVEILDIVKTAWTEPRFSYTGKFHSFADVACVPKPYQKPLPEIRIAASTPDTFP